MLTQRRAAQGQKCSARFTTEILNKKPELHILDYKIEKLTWPLVRLMNKKIFKAYSFSFGHIAQGTKTPLPRVINKIKKMTWPLVRFIEQKIFNSA